MVDGITTFVPYSLKVHCMASIPRDSPGFDVARWMTREAPAKCSSLLVVLVMGQAKRAARSRAGAMSRGIKFYDVRPEA